MPAEYEDGVPPHLSPATKAWAVGAVLGSLAFWLAGAGVWSVFLGVSLVALPAGMLAVAHMYGRFPFSGGESNG